MRESLWQFLFAADIGLPPSISSHFTLLQPKSHKITQILYFLGSRSCKVINVDTINKHITTACYDNIAKLCQKKTDHSKSSYLRLPPR